MDSLLGALASQSLVSSPPQPSPARPSQPQPKTALSLSSRTPMRHSERRSMVTDDGWNLP